MDYALQRFLNAQNQVYLRALEEVRNGKKRTHWMWYIFPQIAGLGHSEMAVYYGIRDIGEATAFINHPVLGPNLIRITAALMALEDRSAQRVFGSPDDLKLRSCVTLFSQVEGAPTIFRQVLDAYFNGAEDALTLAIIRKSR